MPQMSSSSESRKGKSKAMSVADGMSPARSHTIEALESAMSRELDDVRRQLAVGEQHMARQSAEIDRLQKLLFELCDEMRHLDAQVSAKQRAAVTLPEPVAELPMVATNEPSPLSTPDPRRVERKLSALMGLPFGIGDSSDGGAVATSRGTLDEPPPPDVNSVEQRLRAVMGLSGRTAASASVPVGSSVDVASTDRFDHEVTETKKGALALAAKRRLSNRRRRRVSQSPVLHMTIGGLIAACAGMAMQWTPLTEPVDRRTETPPAVPAPVLTADAAKPEERHAISQSLDAAESKAPAPRHPMWVPSPSLQVAGANAQPLLPWLTDGIRLQAPTLVIGSLEGDIGTKLSPPAKDKKVRKKAVPPPVSAAGVKPESAKKGGPKAIASVPAKASVPPADLPQKPLPQPKAKEPPKPVVEAELVLINGGNFILGDGIDGLRDALPHRVNVSPYLIGRHEVTLELWEKVRQWGRDHGYDLSVGVGKGARHPVYGVLWMEAAKWCNARSEMEKLTPCYYADRSLTAVFRSGEANLTNACVKWDANGYRLPTEAEWEVAARGRLEGKRFPWGDQITHQDANYNSMASAPYDKSSQRGVPLAYSGQLPHTAPVGSFKSNGFGLYDMAGNVAEWCWDFYDKHYGIAGLDAATPGAASLALPATKDPRGPGSGATSVVRGGSWRHDATDARCASRFDLPMTVHSPHVGFRVVRRS